MKISEWLVKATKKLQNSEVLTARLDALVLLEDDIGKDRSWILANPDHELTNTQLKRLTDQIERRSLHEPLAYIRGKTEFYGREFTVNKHTLEPRPETETMIDLLKSLNLSNTTHLVDVGTGSGAIAITAKLEHPSLTVYGTDIDTVCIKTAHDNARKHNVDIDFRQGNLLNPLLPMSDPGNWVVIANLPYVPLSHTINKAAMFEPKHAILGGKDGLDYYREMFEQIKYTPNDPSFILTESLPFQHETLYKIASQSSYKNTNSDDFISVFAPV